MEWKKQASSDGFPLKPTGKYSIVLQQMEGGVLLKIETRSLDSFWLPFKTTKRSPILKKPPYGWLVFFKGFLIRRL